ncbi:MAG: pilus assembly protein TadC, partial [Sphingopyxis sp.]|nr:pilus assembly protein TadC [Sphingopyxis sp.]
MNSNLLLAAFTGTQTGPTLMGIDVIWVATMMSAVGVF